MVRKSFVRKFNIAVLAMIMCVSTACGSVGNSENTGLEQAGNDAVASEAAAEDRDDSAANGSDSQSNNSDSEASDSGSEAPSLEEQASSEQEETVRQETDVYGNTLSNLSLDGCFLESDYGDIYFDFNLLGTLCKTEDETRLIYPSILERMNISGNKLYGLSLTPVDDPEDTRTHRTLICVDMDTLESTVLREAYVTDLSVVNDILFYRDLENGYFYSFDPSTEEEKIILEEESASFGFVYKNKIYYSFEKGLYMKDLAGGDALCISDYVVWPPIAYMDRLFFPGYSHGSYGLYSLDLTQVDDNTGFAKDNDGDEYVQPVKLAATHVRDVSLYNNHLYYTSQDNISVLYDIELDSEGNALSQEIASYDYKEELTGQPISQIGEANGYLQFFTYDEAEPDDFSGVFNQFYLDLTSMSLTGLEEYNPVSMEMLEEQYSAWLSTHKDEYVRLTGHEYVAPSQSTSGSGTQTASNNETTTDDPIFQNGMAWQLQTSEDNFYWLEMAQETQAVANQYRAAAGLGALSWNNTLYAAAQIRAAEIVTLFAHQRPDGTQCFTAFNEVGMTLGSGSWGENIAFGQPTSYSVMNSWYNSPGHRENLLKPVYTQGAVACYVHNGFCYWVHLFSS